MLAALLTSSCETPLPVGPPGKPPMPADGTGPVGMSGAEPRAATFTNSIGMTMIHVPGKEAWLAETETTQAQYQAVTGRNPSKFQGADRPVEMVTWNEAVAFCQRLTERQRAAGKLPQGYVYALPPEALWEYACRAGTNGDYAGNLDEMAWYGNTADDQTHAVATKRPNAWGFHDMHGNVWEWCADWYDGDREGRVLRGGCWISGAVFCASGSRDWTGPSWRCNNLGFRPALVPDR